MGVASRALAATVGGFAFTSAAIAAFSVVLPGAQVQSVLWASLIGYAIWTAAAIWVFAARTALKSWMGLVIATAIAAAIIWGLK